MHYVRNATTTSIVLLCQVSFCLGVQCGSDIPELPIWHEEMASFLDDDSTDRRNDDEEKHKKRKEGSHVER